MARIYRCTFRCSYADGTLVEPSLHYLTDVALAGSEPDPDDIASGLWSALGTEFLGVLTNQVTVNDVVASECVIPPAIGVQGSHHVGSVGTGFGAQTELPRALVPLISLNTGIASKSARGHIFLCSPGYKENLATGGIWASSAQGFFNTLATQLDDSYDLGTVSVTHVNPVVYSRTRHVRGQDPHHFRVTGATAQTHPHWLRSRLSNP